MHTANAIEHNGTTLDTRLQAGTESVAASLAATWEQVRVWHRRARSRRALAVMNDRMLRDIGVNRAEARREAAKWFWQA